MITVECQHCGKPIETYPSRKDRTKYCGRQCYAKALSQNQRGQNHPMYGRKHSPESLTKMAAQKRATAKRGPDNPQWKGGRYLSRGYVMVALSTLSSEEQVLFAPMATQSSNRVIPEHRLVMARILSRPLTPAEAVHHVNGSKQDNRPENLQLHGHDDHKRTHQGTLREIKRLRGENELLWLALSTCLSVMSRENG